MSCESFLGRHGHRHLMRFRVKFQANPVIKSLANDIAHWALVRREGCIFRHPGVKRRTSFIV